MSAFPYPEVAFDPGRSDHPVGEAERWWGLWGAASAALRDDPRLVRARTQGLVLTAAQAEQSGFTRSARRAAVHAGRWTAVAPAVVAPWRLDESDEHFWSRRMHALRAAAGTLRRPGHVACGRSAAIMAGLPTVSVPARPELWTPRAASLGPGSAHCFNSRLDPADTTEWFGAPVTVPARTALDIARRRRLDGVLVLDAALRQGLVTRDALDRHADAAAGWPGVQQARELIGLADPRAESPLESILRLRLHDAGLPAPELQLWVGGFRVDLCWPVARLIVEADGRVKYTGDALWREKRREDALRREGWSVERVVWGEVFDGWHATERRLLRYFDPASPTRWSPRRGSGAATA